MSDISIETKPNQRSLGVREKKSLRTYLLEKIRTWINALLEAEQREFLGRGRHERVGDDGNYRNGYRWHLSIMLCLSTDS